MPLPVPNLDDRRFQDLVDDAKRLVQQRCPEWTDHNVSDPGVTLIEAFAYMVDQLLYRLNRVPDRNYVKFLELLGVRLFPPTAARTNVTFWLSAAQPVPVLVPAGSQVATPRGELADTGVTFTTTRDLSIAPCELRLLCSIIGGNLWRDHTDGIKVTGISCFSHQPVPGDVLLVGLSDAVPGCVVMLRLDCQIEGVGVDPERPPVAWEAFDGQGWVPCVVERDETGGLNRAGDIALYVPFSHSPGLVHRLRAGWLRCRVVVPEEGQPFYSSSPLIRSIAAFTAGGVVEAVNAELVRDDVVGISEGVAGQRFALARRPVVPGSEPLAVEVAGGSGWQRWDQVDHFADSEPGDRHFLLDPVAGEIVFGPLVRLADGGTASYGAVPPKGAPIRVRSYRTGGGRNG
ncbi:MAG: putative baseplate assembly protein, partial [Acidimicrobiales bacterium]